MAGKPAKGSTLLQVFGTQSLEMFPLPCWPRLKGLTAPRGEEDRPSLSLSRGLAVRWRFDTWSWGIWQDPPVKAPLPPKHRGFSWRTMPNDTTLRMGEFLCTPGQPPTARDKYWAASLGGHPVLGAAHSHNLSDGCEQASALCTSLRRRGSCENLSSR